MHFNAILNKRSTTEPARKVGQPGFGTGPITTGIVSELLQGTTRCDEQINPDCLRALYKLFYEPVAGDKNSYAIGLLSSLLIYIRYNHFDELSTSGIYPTSIFATRSERLFHHVLSVATRHVSELDLNRWRSLSSIPPPSNVI